MIKIVCDLLGADKPLEDFVAGPIKAINENKDLVVCLSGYEDRIKEALKNYEYNKDQVEIISATEEITNYDQPSRAFKEKPNSSLVLGLKKTKEDELVGGFVSCGSTGAVLVSSIFILGRLEGCRPALAPVLNNIKNEPFCLVDCGANSDCKVEHLIGFAKLGTAYMKSLGIENPRVGLLNNGSESKKGNELTKASHEAFLNEKFNFIGNIEGKDCLSGKADVIVADGFSGNVLLKSIEGTALTIFTELINIAKNDECKETRDALINAVKKVSLKYDYNTQGGALLLGVKKPVIKAHGAGDSNTMYNIIKQCYNLAKNDLVSKTIEALNN